MTTGIEARDFGEAAVLSNQSLAWKVRYGALAAKFLRECQPGSTFVGEALRLYCKDYGLGEPAHPNAWGAMSGGMIRSWTRTGRVKVVGVQRAKDRRSHACLCPLYEVLS
jgi:hypothetical protein